ncbi:MAG: RecX family transcriptional regulator, partial [Anaerolinea sp.]|nr:RecX family transcriptional regulator [Anaerolinea sp.]
DHLARLGYLDDMAFATFWVRERQAGSPLSPRALRYELRRKGVSSDVIEAALAEFDAPEAALRAAEMQARRLRGLTQREFHERLAAHLQRRGFSHGQARQAIQAVIERTNPDFAPEPDTAPRRRPGSRLKRTGLTRPVRAERSDEEFGDQSVNDP